MTKTISAVVATLLLLGTIAHTEAATGPILSGPLATLDLQDATIESVRGAPKGTFTTAQHFGLSPKWHTHTPPCLPREALARGNS